MAAAEEKEYESLVGLVSDLSKFAITLFEYNAAANQRLAKLKEEKVDRDRVRMQAAQAMADSPLTAPPGDDY